MRSFVQQESDDGEDDDEGDDDTDNKTRESAFSELGPVRQPNHVGAGFDEVI